MSKRDPKKKKEELKNLEAEYKEPDMRLGNCLLEKEFIRNERAQKIVEKQKKEQE
jgi:hypothetical protein